MIVLVAILPVALAASWLPLVITAPMDSCALRATTLPPATDADTGPLFGLDVAQHRARRSAQATDRDLVGRGIAIGVCSNQIDGVREADQLGIATLTDPARPDMMFRLCQADFPRIVQPASLGANQLRATMSGREIFAAGVPARGQSLAT